MKKIKPNRKFSYQVRADNGAWKLRLVVQDGLRNLKTDWLGPYDSMGRAVDAGTHMVDELRAGDDVGLNRIDL